MCRSRRELSNAYFVANFRFDTAENEPAKNLQKFVKSANFADPNPVTKVLRADAAGVGVPHHHPGAAGPGSRDRECIGQQPPPDRRDHSEFL